MAIALALGTSACYGVANFLGPLFNRRFPLGGVLLVGQIAATLVALVAVAVAGEAVPGGRAIALAALAGVGNAIGLAGFLRATELGPVSIVAPIGNTGTIIPVVYGLAIGEALHALEAVGIVLAIAGAALAARVPAQHREAHHDIRPRPPPRPPPRHPPLPALRHRRSGRLRRPARRAAARLRGRAILGAARRAHRARRLPRAARRRAPAVGARPRLRGPAAHAAGAVPHHRDAALHPRHRARLGEHRVGVCVAEPGRPRDALARAAGRAGHADADDRHRRGDRRRGAH